MSSDVLVSGPGHGPGPSTRSNNEQDVAHNGDFELTSSGLNQSFGSTTSSATSVGSSGGGLTKTTSDLTDMADIAEAMDDTHNTTATASGFSADAKSSYQPPHFGPSTASTLPHVRSRTADLQRGMNSPSMLATVLSSGPSNLCTGNSKSSSSTSTSARPDTLSFNRPPQAAMFDPTLTGYAGVGTQDDVVYRVAPGLETAPLMPLFSNIGGNAPAVKAGRGAKGSNTSGGGARAGRGAGKARAATGKAAAGAGKAETGNSGTGRARNGQAGRANTKAPDINVPQEVQGRSRILKLKVPKGVKQKKAYEEMIAAAHFRKRKLPEAPVDDEDDDDFEVGRGTEKKLKAEVGAIMRPVRSTRQKDTAVANKRQKDLENALKAIEQDVEEQEIEYWGKPKRQAAKKARAGLKAIPIPVQPEIKKTPTPRPIRAKKPAQKASDADESPKSTPAKRGRAAKNTTGVKKTSPKSATARKVKAAATPKPKAKATQSADVTMQDVDEVVGPPSPASSSSSLSTASSFAPQSSASSRPSPEPAYGHLIDEAEKSDLLDGSAAQETIAQNGIQNAPVVDNNQPLIASRMTFKSAPATPAIQNSTQLVAAPMSLQPNTPARRNQVQSAGYYRGKPYNHNGADDAFIPSPQAQAMPYMANMDPRFIVTNASAGFDANLMRSVHRQLAAQNIGDHEYMVAMGSHNNNVATQSPEDQQLVRVEPKLLGEPPVWSFKRQQLCETLPYYRAYQSGVYQNNGIPYGMLIDGESRQHDVFTHEVIITRCGGGRSGLDASGHRAQAVHQHSSPIGLAFQRALENKLAVVLIAGANYRNSVYKEEWLPHRYNILNHFQVTDVWLEVNDDFQTYCVRLEKIDLEEQSWWAAERYTPGSYEAQRAPIYSCRRCNTPSKIMYNQGWVCLNVNCLSYFKLIDGITGYEATLTNLVYDERFLSERTPYEGTHALLPLAPPLITEEDMIVNARSGTEELFTKGIVCPECRCCSRRTNFRKWTCENIDGCDFEYELPVRTLTARQAQPHLVDSAKYPDTHLGVIRYAAWVGNFDVDIFKIPGDNGAIIGHVFHFKSNDLINALEGGPDDLFREMQEKDFGLMRRPVRQKGKSGEILTSHYAANWGAPYKFVVSQQSKPFTEAPEVIVKALKKMTWAGKAGEDLSGAAFQEFNELLSIGYYENTTIGFHDDGEKELGPTIATLSLGSQAEMMLRPKKSAPGSLGGVRKNARGTRSNALKILLNHGDIVIMHGEGVQKMYEHAVTPRGTLRYALTCRTILPEKLENDAERAEAARLARLPDGHEAWDYDGNQILHPEDEAVTRSRQMVAALQCTLNDLGTMVNHSTVQELLQIGGVDDVIAAYRRVMATAAPPAVAPAAPVDTTVVAPGDVASDAEDNSYVMVSPVQPAGEDTVVEGELAYAIGDLDMASCSSTTSS